MYITINTEKIMKKVFLMSLLAIFMIGTVCAQEKKEEPTSGAKIEFVKKEHDYGKIQKGADGNCVFEFKNVSAEDCIPALRKAVDILNEDFGDNKTEQAAKKYWDSIKQK